jgi:hypothetical protein
VIDTGGSMREGRRSHSRPHRNADPIRHKHSQSPGSCVRQHSTPRRWNQVRRPQESATNTSRGWFPVTDL